MIGGKIAGSWASLNGRSRLIAVIQRREGNGIFRTVVITSGAGFSTNIGGPKQAISNSHTDFMRL
jgi:hypothetical protein